MISKQAEYFKQAIKKNSSSNQTLDEARRNMKNMKVIIKFPEDIKQKELNINNVKCELFNNGEFNREKIIVYFHGGGYCLGISHNTRNFAAQIASQSGVKLLLIDYRLAPEHKYPSAHEDAFAVYIGLINKNYKARDIIFIGDSSGCGLMLSVLFKAREKNISMPAALIFLSPVIDYTKTSKSLITKKKLDPYQYNNPFSIADIFLEGNDVNNEFISPLYGDLSLFPPMLIHGSEHDVFVDDSINLAKKADKQGVDVTLKIWKELWHVFQVTADIVPEAKESLKEICRFINKELNNSFALEDRVN